MLAFRQCHQVLSSLYWALSMQINSLAMKLFSQDVSVLLMYVILQQVSLAFENFQASISFTKQCELGPIVGVDVVYVRVSIFPNFEEYFTLIRSSADADILLCKFHVLRGICEIEEKYKDYICDCATHRDDQHIFYLTREIPEELTRPLDDKTLTLVSLEVTINESISPKNFKSVSHVVGPTQEDVKILPAPIVYLEVDNVLADLLNCSKKYTVGTFHTFTFCSKNLVDPKIDMELNGKNSTTHGPCAKIGETIAQGYWLLWIHYTDSTCQKSNTYFCRIQGIVLPTNEENQMISNITDLNKKSGYTDQNVKRFFSRKMFFLVGGSILCVGVLSVIGYLAYSSYFSGDSKSSLSLSSPSSLTTPVV
ncbi:hypothetical protein Bpfe_004479 [Biomphalaria pfeifferi]|uniref:Uncharacterized protein n=1 Tax=Biomphalaria pfeifferi TaxID=112525 RepID=A0AAD8C4Z9_BIOPF|nr:hypothetical protein Bpfe_004479 [Biomphalaria pfeifferi]